MRIEPRIVLNGLSDRLQSMADGVADRFAVDADSLVDMAKDLRHVADILELAARADKDGSYLQLTDGKGE
jgi:hypothetical protein